MKVKKILLFGGIGLAVLSAFGAKKAFDIKSVVEQLKISLGKIHGWPEIYYPNVRIKIDLLITNPTQIPLDISTGGLIKVTKVAVYDGNNGFLGEANIGIDSISVPANGTEPIENVRIQGPIKGILENIYSGGINKDNLRLVTHISALGREFTIES